jgi:Cu/Ag efflux protein CusF
MITGSNGMRLGAIIFLIGVSVLPLDGMAQTEHLHSAATGKLMQIMRSDHQVVLFHDAIETLGLKGKNTVFYFDSEDVLRGLELGDNVLFHAERRDGKFVVTDMQKTDVGDDEHHH